MIGKTFSKIRGGVVNSIIAATPETKYTGIETIYNHDDTLPIKKPSAFRKRPTKLTNYDKNHFYPFFMPSEKDYFFSGKPLLPLIPLSL